MTRPDPTECAAYYHGYINKAPEGDIIEILRQQGEETGELLRGLPEEKALYRYAPGKWSIKEIVGHLIDAERVFSYRAMCMARNDPSALPSMEQDDYVRFGNFDRRPLQELLEELRNVRSASVTLFQSFDHEMQMRKGTASGCDFTVRTFPFIIAGHERHHLQVLKEKYL